MRKLKNASRRVRIFARRKLLPKLKKFRNVITQRLWPKVRNTGKTSLNTAVILACVGIGVLFVWEGKNENTQSADPKEWETMALVLFGLSIVGIIVFGFLKRSRPQATHTPHPTETGDGGHEDHTHEGHKKGLFGKVLSWLIPIPVVWAVAHFYGASQAEKAVAIERNEKKGLVIENHRLQVSFRKKEGGIWKEEYKGDCWKITDFKGVEDFTIKVLGGNSEEYFVFWSKGHETFGEWRPIPGETRPAKVRDFKVSGNGNKVCTIYVWTSGIPSGEPDKVYEVSKTGSLW